MLLSFTIFPIVAIASTTNGTIDSTYKYAWVENAGWINFGCENCNVQIADVSGSTSANLTGYAWTQNYGWINLNPAQGGVKSDSNGNLSGKAWGEYSGWVDFSGVSIDSNGQFQGATQSNDIIGKINFNFSNDCPGCKVITDWRPSSARTVTTPTATATTGGGGSVNPVIYIPPTPPVGGFSITINNGQPVTSSQTVTLSLKAGSNTKNMAISNTQDFANSGQEPYLPTKQWTLSDGNGVKTVYAKFYTQYGQASQIVFATITLATPQATNTSIKVSPGNACAGVIFKRTLSPGSIGSDVKCLQTILNSDPATKVATKGVGSPGHETNLFGNATMQALNKFQEKYAKEILTPQKKKKGNGIVGPATMKKLNSLNK